MKKATKRDTHSTLLEAAGELFAQAGFAATSTRAIADRAGTNMALIQYHFGGKEGLLDAVLTDWVRELQQRMEFALEMESRPGYRRQILQEAFIHYAVVLRPAFAALVVRESASVVPNPTSTAVGAALAPLIDLFDKNQEETARLSGRETVAVLLALCAVQRAMPALGASGNGSAAGRKALAWANAILEVNSTHRTAPVAPVEAPADAIGYREPPAFDFVD